MQRLQQLFFVLLVLQLIKIKIIVILLFINNIKLK